LSPQDEPAAPSGAAKPEQAAELIETIETVDAPGLASQEPQDPIVEAFDDVCRRLAGFDDNLHTEWVDGYLTAVAASWRAVPPDEVLPRMCGDAFERAFAPRSRSLARRS